MVLGLGLVLTMGGVVAVRQQSRAEDREHFEREAEEQWLALQARLVRTELFLQRMREFCTRSVNEPPERFAELWRERVALLRMNEEVPFVWEVGYAVLETSEPPRLAEGANQLFIKTDAQVTVVQRQRKGPRDLAPKGDNLYVTPQARAIHRAWDQGKSAISDHIELGKTFAGEPRQGFRLFMPVFDELHTKATPRPRGVFFASVLLAHLVKLQFGDKPRAVEFEVYAGSEVNPAACLTAPVRYANGNIDRTIVADSPDPLRHTLHKEVFGEPWTIVFRNTVVFQRKLSDSMLLWMGVSGAILSLTMCVAVRLQVVRRLEAEAAAQSLEISENKVRREGEERERLVRDLHERTIQSLLAVNAQLVRCAGMTELPGNSPLRGELDAAAADLEAAVNEVRDGILRVGPATEAEVPFRGAMEDWLARLNRGHGASLTFESDASLADSLRQHARTELTAIIREAVSNALRHGHAERVVVSLRAEQGQGLLVVQDDGSGFDPAATAGTGHGLKHLRQRAKDLGGECVVDSRPGGPTNLRVRFPVAAPESTGNPRG